MVKTKKVKMYTAICHTTCFWLDTLWQPGEQYEGEFEPNRHFSKDGLPPDDMPTEGPALDPRSTKQLQNALKAFGASMPITAGRKKIWAKLRDLEMAAGQDAVTNPDTDARVIERSVPEAPKTSRKVKSRKPRVRKVG